MTYDESPLYSIIDKHEILKQHEAELKGLVETSILPSYQSLHIFYRDEYHPKCREQEGISGVRGGKKYYEYLTKSYTTSDVTPDAVFNTGVREVARIKEQMILTQAELGYDGISLEEFFTVLRTDKEFYYTDKEELLKEYRRILDRMDSELPMLFGKLPRTPYDLKELEAYRAKAAPAAYYYRAPEDGSRPGYFYVNTYDLSSRPKFTMTALALHEAVPGHHLQIALAQEMEDMPWFRNQMSVTAFIEGWGLYAEFLGYESGMYEDPLQKMGALSFEMWRACRLVVDVGLHYKDWTREEAMDFMRASIPISELDINSEIDRYISWPGQALAYKTGELKMKEFRQQAESALGDAFRITEFHDMILGNGAVPFTVLESQVEAWIRSKQ